jgi:hypothetical protein
MQPHVLALALYETAVPDRNGFKLKRRELSRADLLTLNLGISWKISQNIVLVRCKLSTAAKVNQASAVRRVCPVSSHADD